MFSTISLMSALASVGLAAPEPHLYGYGYPGLYSAPSSNMALMEGKFVSKKIHPNQEAVVKMYNGVWGYDEDAPVEGVEVVFKNVDGGVQLEAEGLTLDLLLNKETTSTEWTEGGEEMKTYTWRTGPSSVRIRNSVEDIGVVEIQDINFLPTGIAISSTVTKPAEFKSAVKSEFWERVDEDGKAKPLALGWI